MTRGRVEPRPRGSNDFLHLDVYCFNLLYWARLNFVVLYFCIKIIEATRKRMHQHAILRRVSAIVSSSFETVSVVSFGIFVVSTNASLLLDFLFFFKVSISM